MQPTFDPDLDDVTVVMVTYHSRHCMALHRDLFARVRHVVVSDNGSGDGTQDELRAVCPHALLLDHQRNLGFGAANNRALAHVRTPFALLLNPDCHLSRDALLSLLQAHRSLPDVAVTAPQLVDGAGQPEVNYRWPSLYWTSKGPAAEAPVCVGFVCGAAMLCRLSSFEGVGWFDERFFLYYEDDDLCLRLFQARRPMVVWPAIKATHRSRGSVRGRQPWRSEYLRGYHHAQSKLIFTAKHQTLLEAQALRRRLLLSTWLALPLRIVLVSPRLIARMIGRLRGAMDWTL